MGVTNYTRA